MTAISASRTIIALLAFLACGAALAIAIQYVRREPPVDTSAATTAPVISKPEQSPAPLAKAQAETKAVVDALIGSPPSPESSDGVPTFDVARIEPTGEAVIAGRAAPGATVELLRDGEVHDRAVADKSGQFVMVPPKLPPGTYDLTLRSKAAGRHDGHVQTARDGGAGAEIDRAAGRGAGHAGQTHRRAVATGCGQSREPAPWSWRRSRSSRAASSM